MYEKRRIKMVTVKIIGTGGVYPIPKRRLPVLYIENGDNDGRACLIDCGEGTQVALREMGINMGKIDAIYITHTHADHVMGLPGLLMTIGLSERTKPLDVYTPVGTKTALLKLFEICGPLPYELKIHEVGSGDTVKQKNYKAEAFSVKHTVTCMGYNIIFEKPAHFDVQKAKAIGFDPRNFKILLADGEFNMDGKIITPDMVTDGADRSFKICYLTDSAFCENFVENAKDADLFVCEAMYADEEKYETAQKKRHMMMQQACEIAKKANVKNLWFTHISPAWNNPFEFEKTAKELFEGSHFPHDGETGEFKF